MQFGCSWLSYHISIHNDGTYTISDALTRFDMAILMGYDWFDQNWIARAKVMHISWISGDAVWMLMVALSSINPHEIWFDKN